MVLTALGVGPWTPPVRDPAIPLIGWLNGIAINQLERCVKLFAGDEQVAYSRQNVRVNYGLPRGALNSAVECHLHTVEVAGSNPAAPTINH
jgi:hypothetical protein